MNGDLSLETRQTKRLKKNKKTKGLKKNKKTKARTRILYYDVF